MMPCVCRLFDLQNCQTTSSPPKTNTEIPRWIFGRRKSCSEGSGFFEGVKVKMNPWKSSRPFEKIGRWTCWWNKSLLKFFGPKRLLLNGPLLWTPRMNVSKSTLDHQPKTDDSDPPPIVMKPGSNPSRLVLPISWEFSFSWWWWGTWLRWLFRWWPNSPRRLHVFFLSKLGPGVSLFGYYSNAPIIEMMLLRDIFVCPLHHATNKERHQFKWDWLFQIALCLFFSETFPPY